MTVLSALCLATCILSSHAMLRNVKPSIDRLSAGRDSETQETATAFFDFIAGQMSLDKDEDCIGSFDQFASPSFTMCERTSECKTKEEVMQLFCETENEVAGPTFIQTGLEELEDVVVLSGMWVMQHLDECVQVPFDAQLEFDANGQISKWIDTEYEDEPCDVSTSTTKAAIADSDYRLYSAKRGKESDRKRILDKFYELGVDLYKRNRDYAGTVDEELEDILDDFTDDFSFCAEINGEKECFDGAGGFKQAYEHHDEHYADHIDYSKSITKKGDNLYEIVCTATYENDDASCKKSMETSMFTFRGNKIRSIDFSEIMVDCKKNMPKKKKKAKAGAVVDEREDVITDFYDLLMDKLFSADTDDLTAKDAVDSFLEMTSETMNVCSFDGDDLKKCKDKREIIEMLREHRKSSKGTVFEGIDMGTMSTDGDRVSVEVTLSYLDEETGCVLERTQMDEFVFDADGKIAEYDNIADSEETNCEGNEEERLYARGDFNGVDDGR